MWLREHALILVLFVLYTGVLVHHALIGQRRTRDLADFLVGGRSLGGVILGVLLLRHLRQHEQLHRLRPARPTLRASPGC